MRYHVHHVQLLPFAQPLARVRAALVLVLVVLLPRAAVRTGATPVAAEPGTVGRIRCLAAGARRLAARLSQPARIVAGTGAWADQTPDERYGRHSPPAQGPHRTSSSAEGRAEEESGSAAGPDGKSWSFYCRSCSNAEPFSLVLRLKSDRSAPLSRRADFARFSAQRLAGEHWRFGRQVLCLGKLGEGAARPH